MLVLESTSCSCPRARARVLLARGLRLVLSCSSVDECSSALVLVLVLVFVLECSCSSALVLVFLYRTIQTSQVFFLRLFVFCSVCCCKIVCHAQLFWLNSKPCWDTAAVAPPSPPARVRIRSSSTNSYNTSRAATHAPWFLQHKL